MSFQNSWSSKTAWAHQQLIAQFFKSLLSANNYRRLIGLRRPKTTPCELIGSKYICCTVCTFPKWTPTTLSSPPSSFLHHRFPLCDLFNAFSPIRTARFLIQRLVIATAVRRPFHCGPWTAFPPPRLLSPLRVPKARPQIPLVADKSWPPQQPQAAFAMKKLSENVTIVNGRSRLQGRCTSARNKSPVRPPSRSSLHAKKQRQSKRIPSCFEWTVQQ